MNSLAQRIEASGANLEEILKNALEVTKEYAGSDEASATAIPQLYKKMILAQLEVFEPEKKKATPAKRSKTTPQAVVQTKKV